MSSLSPEEIEELAERVRMAAGHILAGVGCDHAVVACIQDSPDGHNFLIESAHAAEDPMTALSALDGLIEKLQIMRRQMADRYGH